jgi:hypothetical protein
MASRFLDGQSLNQITTWLNETTTAGKVYTYYDECKGRREGNGCTEKKIHAEVIEDMLEFGIMDTVGNGKTRTKVVIPATDKTA